MQSNIFSPKVQDQSEDVLSAFFLKAAQTILVVFFGLLPLFFVPNVFAPIGFTKSFFLIVGVFAAIIFACLSVLRSGKVRLLLPLPLLFFWLFALFAVASALLSGDVHDSLFGVAFEPQTAGFYVLMAIVMTVTSVFAGSKQSFSRFFWLTTFSTTVIFLLYISRLVFGADFLSFGIFNTNSISTLGSINDLAIYAGLMIVIVLTVISRLANMTQMMAAGVLTVTSLFLIAVANFSFIWMVTGFLSLLTFLYLVAKDTWLKNSNEEEKNVSGSRYPLVLVAFICVVSGAFIVSGDYLGQKVSTMTGVSYVEVRPSLSATFDITKNVYRENILWGTGPNRFEDAWREYKDPVINQTQFWNTNFSSGNSLVSTLFTTTGLVGAIVFIVFLASLLLLSYKTVFINKAKNVGWGLAGLLSFSATFYLWLMTFVYSPGSSVMLLTAIATGLSLAVWLNSKSDSGTVIDVAYSRQHGLLLIASALVIIVGSTVFFIKINKQYLAQVAFADSIVELSKTGNIDDYDNALIKASEYDSKQDVYLVERARLRLAELNRLRSLSNPTENDQKLYSSNLELGIVLTEQAVTLDASNPYNRALLGSFYGSVNSSDNEAIRLKREESFSLAKKLDPTNPEYDVLEAQLTAQFGDLVKAREFLNSAVSLKNNYTDALFLLSQLDIQEGNATSAIATTLSIISIEPYNPGRYFQLGLLLLSSGNLPDAIISLEAAIQLDPNYANARYMLALSYLDSNRVAEALEQLKLVEASNPDNQELKDLISQVESGQTVSSGSAGNIPVKEADTTTQNGDATVTSEAPDTDLVTPVNRVPRANEAPDTTSQNSTENNPEGEAVPAE